MSCERFREEHQRQGKPLKISGGTDAWPARRWSVEALRARFAEREVSLTQTLTLTLTLTLNLTLTLTPTLTLTLTLASPSPEP
jgi:hypothetical protein